MEDKLQRLVDLSKELNELHALNAGYYSFFEIVDEACIGGVEDSPTILNTIAKIFRNSGFEDVASKIDEATKEVEGSMPDLLKFNEDHSKKVLNKRQEIKEAKRDIIDSSDNVGCLKIDMGSIRKGHKADSELEKIAEDNNFAVEHVGGRAAIVFGAIKQDLIKAIKDSDSKILKGALFNQSLPIKETKLGDENLVAHKGQIIRLDDMKAVEGALSAGNKSKNSQRP